MWGAISTDFIYQQNFNIGFSTLKSDNLVHLTQWQYWWWFWFSFIWTLYFLFVNKTLRFRVMKMKPKIVTSYRSHGKWGDFLACIVPAIWCYNILVNSSFIMRLAEWQNETSLFSVRVRGKQWYWIYKFELRTVIDILSVPRNLSLNRWVVNSIGMFEVSDNYFFALKLRSQNVALKTYWNKYLKDLEKLDELNAVNYLDKFSFNKEKASSKKNFKYFLSGNFNKNLPYKFFNSFWSFSGSFKNFTVFFNDRFFSNSSWNDVFNQDPAHSSLLTYNKFFDFFTNKSSHYSSYNTSSKIYNFSEGLKNPEKNNFLNKRVLLDQEILQPSLEEIFSLFINKAHLGLIQEKRSVIKYYNLIDFGLNKKFLKTEDNYVNIKFKHGDSLESSRFIKHKILEISPIVVHKPLLTFLSSNSIKNNNSSILNVVFNEDIVVEKKNIIDQYYMIVKQKRYKRKKNIPERIKNAKNYDGSPLKNSYKLGDKPYITLNRVIEASRFRPTKLYRALKKNKLRHENISVQFAKRLLRTKKVLVLPANTNLTIISNSYDVVHSWFLPSLGIKIDCIPGRATHHSFYCDNIGFYYGQCAEVCGRYHHHMPIRLCILTFDQFLVWWYHFGLPKFLFTKPKNRYETAYSNKTFNW